MGAISAGFTKFKGVAEKSNGVMQILGPVVSGSMFQLPSQTTSKGPTVDECERWQPRKAGALDDASHIIGSAASITGALSFLGPITAGISQAFSFIDGALGLFKEPKKDLGKMAMQCMDLRFKKMERWVKEELAKLHGELDTLDATQFSIFGSLISVVLTDLSSTSNRTKRLFGEIAYGLHIIEASACADGSGDCASTLCEVADVNDPSKCSHPPKPAAWPGQFTSIDLQTLLDLSFDSKRAFDQMHTLLFEWSANVASWSSRFSAAQVAENTYINEAGGRLYAAQWSAFASATVVVSQLAEAIVRVMRSYATTGPSAGSKSAFTAGETFDFRPLLDGKESIVLPTGWDIDGIYGKWLNPSHPQSLGQMFLNSTTVFVDTSSAALPDKYSFVDRTPPSGQSHGSDTSWALRFCALQSTDASSLDRANDTGMCFSRAYDDTNSQQCRQPCDTVPGTLQFNVHGPSGELRKIIAEWPTCRSGSAANACLDLYDETPGDDCKTKYVAEALQYPRCAKMMIDRYEAAVADGKLPTCEPMQPTQPDRHLCRDSSPNPDGTYPECTGIPGRDFTAAPTCDNTLVQNGVTGFGCWAGGSDYFKPPTDALDYLNRCLAPSREDELNHNNPWYDRLWTVVDSSHTRAAFRKFVVGNLIGQIMPVVIAGNSRRNLFGQLISGDGKMVAAENANHEVLPISGYTPVETTVLKQLAGDSTAGGGNGPSPPPFTLAVDGPCQVVDHGACVASPNHGSGAAHLPNEACTITGFPAAKPRFEIFDVEDHLSCMYDDLTINGIRFCGHWKPPGSATAQTHFFSSDPTVKDPRELTPDTSLPITWKSDHSVQHNGFKLCWDRDGNGGGGGGGGGGSDARAAVINEWLAPVGGRIGRLCSADEGAYELTYDKACGGESRFVVIATTTDGKSVGGYMPVSWKQVAANGGYSERRGAAAVLAESKAFLFSLGEGASKYDCTAQNYCLHTTSNTLGWGGGVDMYLTGNTGGATPSFACARHSYGQWNANGNICGSKQTAKVEIFAVDDLS